MLFRAANLMTLLLVTPAMATSVSLVILTGCTLRMGREVDTNTDIVSLSTKPSRNLRWSRQLQDALCDASDSETTDLDQSCMQEGK